MNTEILLEQALEATRQEGIGLSIKEVAETLWKVYDLAEINTLQRELEELTKDSITFNI